MGRDKKRISRPANKVSLSQIAWNLATHVEVERNSQEQQRVSAKALRAQWKGGPHRLRKPGFTLR